MLSPRSFILLVLPLAGCSAASEPSQSDTPASSSDGTATGGGAISPGGGTTNPSSPTNPSNPSNPSNPTGGTGGSAPQIPDGPEEGWKYAPRGGKVILAIGQDNDSIDGYTAGVENDIGGFTVYIGLRNPLSNLSIEGHTVAGRMYADESLARYPGAVMMIGANAVNNGQSYAAEMASGARDTEIDALGSYLMGTGRPTLLRIGYEFDGIWNNYQPNDYIAMYKRIVDRFRAMGVENVAYVWQSAAHTTGTLGNQPITAWYPGDDYVDWCGISYFQHTTGPQNEMLNFARSKNLPVLIAEAAPQGTDTEALTVSANYSQPQLQSTTGDQIWQSWFSPFLAMVHQNADVVRGISYINADWDSQQLWGPPYASGYWGDTRIEANATLTTNWQQEVSDTAFWQKTMTPGFPELQSGL